MDALDVGTDFYHRLANRDERQGDGRHNAVEFRKKYLKGLDDPAAWENDDVYIVLDFSNVKKLGPSFANEAFAYFTRYSKNKSLVKKKINFINISKVKEETIDVELESGYKR